MLNSILQCANNAAGWGSRALGSGVRGATQRAELASLHVVVIGGSISGLLAARALSDHVARVTLVERDELGAGPELRKGVPQGSHTHGILVSGLQLIEGFFPGIGDEAGRLGATTDDPGRSMYILSGSKLRATELGVGGLVCGRPLLEALIRRRVLALPNVQLRSPCEVLGLVVDNGVVRAARVEARGGPAGGELIPADLVLDASGRGSKASRWLRELGYLAPRVDRVEVGVHYTSALYRRRPWDFPGNVKAVVVDTVPPNRRAGVAAAIDRDHWIITLIGYLGERAQPSHEGFLQFASGMPSPELHEFLKGAEAVSAFTTMGFRENQRRRFDELDRHPVGFVVLGDALCCFNPRFGQGMTVATMEARTLTECLRSHGLSSLARHFYRRTRPLLDAAWSSSVGSDLRFSEVKGKRSWVGNILNRYVAYVCRVGAHDAEVARGFLRVVNMLDGPSSLFSPTLLIRLLLRRRTLLPAGSGATLD